jgi:hypothetical protein
MILFFAGFLASQVIWLVWMRPVLGSRRMSGANFFAAFMADFTICGELARAGDRRARTVSRCTAACFVAMALGLGLALLG